MKLRLRQRLGAISVFLQRHRRVVLIVSGVVVGLIALVASPLLFRHFSFFKVRQVELVGVRFLAPDEILDVLALEADQNVFDDFTEAEKRLVGRPGIVRARVTRRLPGTVRVTVSERVPVALAPGPAGMVALDAEARPLPYDPTASGLDLPIVERPDSALTGTLAVLNAVDPDMFQEIDVARSPSGRDVILHLGERRLLFRGVPSVEDVSAVGSVRRHLADVGRTYGELDARFDGWVVVRGGRA